MKKEKLDKDFIEVTADGKQEIEHGKEPLNKQPEGGEKPFPLDAAQSNYQDAQNEEEEKKKKKKDKIKKSIPGRWDLIKKNLKHEDAFMDMMSEDEEDEDEEEQQEPEQEGEAEPEESEEEAEGDNDITDEEHGHLNDLLGEEGGEEDEEIPPQGEGTEETPTPKDEEGINPEDVPEDVVEAAGGEEEIEEMSDEELTDLMQKLGHSEKEIAYVLHGHAPPVIDPTDQAKMQQAQEAHQANIQQGHESHQVDIAGKRQDQQIRLQESGLTSGQTGKINELDLTHKKKMNELEYEMARKEKELELEHKRKQLELEHRHAESESDNKLHNSKKEDAVKRKHKEEQHQKKLKEPTAKPVAKNRN